MLNSLRILRLLDQVKEGEGAAPPVPPTPAAKPENQPAPAANNPPAQESGDKFDDFGYPIVKDAAPAEGEKPKAPEPQKEAPAPVAEPATGYGAEPPKVEPEAPAPPALDPAVPPAEKTELDKVLEAATLPKEETAAIKEFATKHSMTPDQVKAYAELRKSELADAEKHAQEQVKAAERHKIEQRASWDKELREDSTFGGTNFSKSVQTAEKVLNDFFPNFKKKLTESKGMLPPYLMRDLAKLGETLYATPSLVQGEPPSGPPKTEDKNSFLNDMYK